MSWPRENRGTLPASPGALGSFGARATLYVGGHEPPDLQWVKLVFSTSTDTRLFIRTRNNSGDDDYAFDVTKGGGSVTIPAGSSVFGENREGADGRVLCSALYGSPSTGQQGVFEQEGSASVGNPTSIFPPPQGALETWFRSSVAANVQINNAAIGSPLMVPAAPLGPLSEQLGPTRQNDRVTVEPPAGAVDFQVAFRVPLP